MNDTDVDGDTLTVMAVSNPTGGDVTMATDSFTFTPTSNFNGGATFDYTVTDGEATATGHATIVFDAVNDAPVAVDDDVATDEDASKAIAMATLVANDTDTDHDTLSISAVSNATHGTATINGTNIDFVPDTHFHGTGGFDYTVTDGTLTDTGHVTVSVAQVNHAPVAVDDIASVQQDAPQDFQASTFLGNDTDIDNDTLTITDVGNASHCTAVLAGTTITVTPEAGFSGAASFDYTVSDGTATDTGTVAVTVVSANCGDGAITGGETCDDGNTADGDGCDHTCQTEAGFTCDGTPSVCSGICGDGLVVTGEGCDDSNTADGDGCDHACEPEHGFTCTGTAPSVCTSTCGDGLVASDEACDDGNVANLDGCSSTCFIERGFDCTGEPSSCASTCGDGVLASDEECDDDNLVDHDGCSATCKIERVCEFTFTGANGNEPTFPADVTLTATGVTNPVMSRGAGVTAAAAGGVFSGSSWNTATLDDTAFYSFTLTPEAGVSMTMLSFVFGDQRSGTGPTQWTLRSSLDSFTADIATSATHPAPLTSQTIALDAASFTALIVPVEFRIYAFNTASAAGTWRIDNVRVVGFTQGP
jgi:cysteine-rich repeat protein